MQKLKEIKKSQAFTLIELLVVISIIGLLSTLSIVSLNGARAKARDAKRMSDLKMISDAVERYNIDNGEYPDSIYIARDIADCNQGNLIAATAVENGSGEVDYNIAYPICSNGTFSSYIEKIPTPPMRDEYYYYYWDGPSGAPCIASFDMETQYVALGCLGGNCIYTDNDLDICTH